MVPERLQNFSGSQIERVLVTNMDDEIPEMQAIDPHCGKFSGPLRQPFSIPNELLHRKTFNHSHLFSIFQLVCTRLEKVYTRPS